MARIALQRCLNHSSREAVARCLECGQFFCRECITEHDERVVCAACLQKLVKVVQKPPRRRINLWPIFQGASGLLLTWFVFYVLGQMLLGLPESVHDGSLWNIDTVPDPEESGTGSGAGGGTP